MSAPDPPCFLLNLQFTLRSRQRWVFCVNLLPERKDHGLVPPLNRTGAPNQAGMGWQRSGLDLLGSPIILPSQLAISRSHWRQEIPEMAVAHRPGAAGRAPASARPPLRAWPCGLLGWPCTSPARTPTVGQGVKIHRGPGQTRASSSMVKSWFCHCGAGARRVRSFIRHRGRHVTTSRCDHREPLRLVIDGHEIAVFSELSGIIAEIEPSEYWETSGEAINGPLTASRWRPGL
jgi:hypothetical protein